MRKFVVGEWAQNGLPLLTRALDATQNGIMITDATASDDPIVYVNRAFEEITGYASEEVLGHNPRFLQAGDGNQTALDDLRGVRRAHNDDIQWAGVIRNYRKDGELFYNELSAAAVRDAAGCATHHIGVMSDVTKRELTGEKVRFQARLLDAVGQAVVAVDLSRRVVYWNRAAEEIYGWSSEEAVGRIVEDVVVSEDQLGLAGEIWSELAAGRSWSGEFVVRRRDGTSFSVMVTDTPVFDERGALVGVIGVSTDITERKLAEAAQGEANRRLADLATLRADFTAMVAHELGSPLAAVSAYADVLATGELGPEERDQALGKISTETDILKALVADVRFAASVEREDFSLRIRTVAVGRLLDDAVAFAETLPGTHLFAVEAASPDEEVVADPYRIGQVLRNLLSNAAKYTPEGTLVTLRAVPAADESRGSRGPTRVVRIEVVDRGPGIHPDDARRVFEKFGRGRDREGRKVPGAGLGLYLSRRIVRAHGSDLSMRSEPHEGSVFSFELEVARGDRAGQ